MVLFTAGYEGATIEEYVKALHDNGVTRVIDVRRVPFSWKRGFRKAAIGKILQDECIAYEHCVSLGCPQFIRDKYKKDNDWKWYECKYNTYLDSNIEVLLKLIDLVSKEPLCLLCFERNPERCHRGLIAKKLKDLTKGSVSVCHIYPSQFMALKTRRVDSDLQPALLF